MKGHDQDRPFEDISTFVIESRFWDNFSTRSLWDESWFKETSNFFFCDVLVLKLKFT